jgi:sugar/nucleoside kinase (ribokinase family)
VKKEQSLVNGDEIVECGIQKNLKIVDLTGAGDLFAAGFLHCYVNELSIKECLEKGTGNVIKSNTTNWSKNLISIKIKNIIIKYE